MNGEKREEIGRMNLKRRGYDVSEPRQPKRPSRERDAPLRGVMIPVVS